MAVSPYFFSPESMAFLKAKAAAMKAATAARRANRERVAAALADVLANSKGAASCATSTSTS